VTAVTVM